MGRRRLATAGVVTAVSLTLVVLVVIVVVLGSPALTGPFASTSGVPALAASGALAVATVSTAAVLTRSAFGWHGDAIACCALLVCFAASLAAGWQDGPDSWRSASTVIAPLAAPALLGLVERRARRRLTWTWTLACVTLTLSVARYVVRDPFLDPDCWVDCSLAGAAPAPSAPLADVVEPALLVVSCITVGSALALTARLVATWRRPESSSLDIAVAVAASASAVAATVGALANDRGVVAQSAEAACWAYGLLGVAVAGQPAVALARRHQLRSLAARLADRPPLGTLEQSLARALGVRDLEVAYWLPRSGRYVAADGTPTSIRSRWTISLERQGAPLAMIGLDRPPGDARELAGLVGSAALLAIDNERLQAELRSQLAELRASRLRVVAAADDVRRRVERDLHDVVQAELVGSLLELGRVRAEAERQGDTESAGEATRLLDGLRAVVADLRDFARGVYPAVLDGQGLVAALDALADESRVALTMDCPADLHAPLTVERTAYLVVHEALTRAETGVGVTIRRTDADLVLRLDGGPGRIRHEVLDRVRALGGEVRFVDGGVQAVLPCG